MHFRPPPSSLDADSENDISILAPETPILTRPKRRKNPITRCIISIREYVNRFSKRMDHTPTPTQTSYASVTASPAPTPRMPKRKNKAQHAKSRDVAPPAERMEIDTPRGPTPVLSDLSDSDATPTVSTRSTPLPEPSTDATMSDQDTGIADSMDAVSISESDNQGAPGAPKVDKGKGREIPLLNEESVSNPH